MYSEQKKMQLFATWVILVCLAGIALGSNSVSNWIVVACMAIVPPLVARSFWRVPEQTISESIRDARR
jgi:hypothetical protein